MPPCIVEEEKKKARILCDLLCISLGAHSPSHAHTQIQAILLLNRLKVINITPGGHILLKSIIMRQNLPNHIDFVDIHEVGEGGERVWALRSPLELAFLLKNLSGISSI